MKPCIRKANKEDFFRINELFVEMLRAIYGSDNENGYRDGDLDYYFTGGDDLIYVAEISGNIEAFLAVEVHREEQNYLYYDDFCVSSEYRGQGIGSAMLVKAEEYCRSLGLSAAVLHVEETNINARRFYGKKGFTLLRKDGTRLCMVKQLT